MSLSEVVKSHKPALPGCWRLLDELPCMGARYERTDRLRAISSTIIIGGESWYHVSCARLPSGPSQSDIVDVRAAFIPDDVVAVKGDMPGMPRLNPCVVHIWARAGFGEAVPMARNG
jgi:hypothetical protein